MKLIMHSLFYFDVVKRNSNNLTLIKVLMFISLVVAVSNFTSNVNAQVREDRQTGNFQYLSEKLTSAKGYYFSESNGKWVENENAISHNNCTSKYCLSKAFQNFKWLRFATIMQNNQTYYVMLWEQYSGSYRYPNIRQDWRIHKETKYFIMKEFEIINIINFVKNQSGIDTTFKSQRIGSTSDRFDILGGEHEYSEENLLASITQKLNEDDLWEEHCFVINSQYIEGIDVIRFILPRSCILPYETKDRHFEISQHEFLNVLEEIVKKSK